MSAENLEKLLREYREYHSQNIRNWLEQLRNKGIKDRADELIKYLHILRGSGTLYGFPEVSKIAEKLGKRCEKKTVMDEEIEAGLSRILEIITRKKE